MTDRRVPIEPPSRRFIDLRWNWLTAMIVFTAHASLAAEPLWHHDWSAAEEEARRADRPILIVFTGSDWCPHCRLLERDVLATAAFRSWAAERFVLLEIDLPKSGITRAVRDERAALCRRFDVVSFPQVVVTSAEGGRLGGVKGYARQPADDWIASLSHEIVRHRGDSAIPAAPALVIGPEPGSPHVPSGEPFAVDSLAEAVERSGHSRRPVLVVVSRASDDVGRSCAASLVANPEFRAFAESHFEMATVESTCDIEDVDGMQAPEERIDSLLGAVPLPEH